MDELHKWFYEITKKLTGWEEIDEETLADKIKYGVNGGLISIKLRADLWGRTWCFTTKRATPNIF